MKIMEMEEKRAEYRGPSDIEGRGRMTLDKMRTFVLILRDENPSGHRHDILPRCNPIRVCA